MNKTKLLEEIRLMRFTDIYTQWNSSTLTAEEAAIILGVHKRTFRRQCRSYEENGADGLYDARLNQIAHNAAPVDEVMDMLNIFQTTYPDFTTAHFFDKWQEQHNGQRSYSWVKKNLQSAGLVKKTKLRGTHRKKRARKPLPGMMLHQDGSTHYWVPNVKWDLIVTMDDATSEIYSAFFVDEEGTWSSFVGVQEVILKKGIFCSLYTDRGSHYWYTAEAGGKVDKSNLTQFGRAMRQMGIEMIAAYSPEARGRSERVFRTLQDRLPKELALTGITTMEAANIFLKTIFIPKHNNKFSVAATETGSAFVPFITGVSLADILCIQEQRTVNNDNTVKYKTKVLQLPPDKYRDHYLKCKVKINEYINGEIAVFYGPRKLANYDSEGRLIDMTQNISTSANQAVSA